MHVIVDVRQSTNAEYIMPYKRTDISKTHLGHLFSYWVVYVGRDFIIFLSATSQAQRKTPPRMWNKVVPS